VASSAPSEALGGFFLPPLFAYTQAWTGLPQSTFFILFLLTLVCAIWMHLTVYRMLHANAPELRNTFEQHETTGA
jgi:NNP family nitrate/nitrite transporter-like MFS transporter